MLEPIEKLLILQERDRKIAQIEEELSHVPMERQRLQSKLAAATSNLDAARLKVKQLETERKKLELDVDSKKGLIEKYSLQQFQTRKNEEYRALSHEIDTCRADISKLEDGELELMEQIDTVQKEVAQSSKIAAETKRDIDSLLSGLLQREQALTKELSELRTDREQLAGAVDDSLRQRYQRLFQHKGNNVVVGIDHGVCNGCHMQLSRQIVVSCQAEQEIFSCPNCGRILYYTSDMDVAVAE
jgi:uncharacterized protein